MTVTLEKVAKRYGRHDPWVISDIDLELPESAVTLVGGANGSGKTTLLRIIAGLTLPNVGMVRGRPRRVAVVPDRFVAPTRMTCRAYLGHHGRIRGLPATRARQQAAELGERLAVLPGLDAPIQDLSKGNAQKVAVAQAFMAPVDLLVLDEPRAGLDAPAASVLDELLAEARKAGATTVLSDPTPGPHYPDARRYQLVGGHLRPVDGTPATSRGRVTIRLLPLHPGAMAKSADRADRAVAADRADAAGAAASFDALAVSASPDEGGLTLVVDPDRSDEVLRFALSDGWSVVCVQRDTQLPEPA